MKFCTLTLCAVLVLAAGPAQAVVPTQFRSFAPVVGDLPVGRPVRLPLSREVFAASDNTLHDIRLFDDTHAETPFVIYQEPLRAADDPPFPFEVVSYEAGKDTTTMVLRRPQHAARFNRLTFSIGARDYKKMVVVETGSEDTVWIPVAHDIIFDFASRIAFRKTTIDLPDAGTPLVRLTLTDAPVDTPDSLQVKVQLGSDAVEMSGQRPVSFRIDAITGQYRVRETNDSPLDEWEVDHPAVTINRDKQTELVLDAVRLPVARVRFAVDNPYYSRSVQLFGNRQTATPVWEPVASGELLFLTGMAEARNVLTVGAPRFWPSLKVQIANGDNPPLRVARVTVAWARHNLYFIPEAGRRYTLHVGDAAVAPPDYEVGRLIPDRAEQLHHLPLARLGSLSANADWQAVTPPGALRAKYETKLLIVICALLVALIGVWSWRLMQRVRATPPGRDPPAG